MPVLSSHSPLFGEETLYTIIGMPSILRQQQKDKSMLSWREHPKVIPYRKKFSLGYVVERLVSTGLSVRDILPLGAGRQFEQTFR